MSLSSNAGQQVTAAVPVCGLGAEEGEHDVEVVRGSERGGGQQRGRRVELERRAAMVEAEVVTRVR
jgi:hypothetical protein